MSSDIEKVIEKINSDPEFLKQVEQERKEFDRVVNNPNSVLAKYNLTFNQKVTILGNPHTELRIKKITDVIAVNKPTN
jgi:hypothetical protein